MPIISNSKLSLIHLLASSARGTLLSYVRHPDSQSAFWHNRENLAGTCAIASVFLLDCLQQEGVVGGRLVRGHFVHSDGKIPHVWVEIANSGETFIVDITATQFENHIEGYISPVLIVPVDSEIGSSFVERPYKAFYVRNKFCFWISDAHPWGRIGSHSNGKLSHQGWLRRARMSGEPFRFSEIDVAA